MITTVAPVNTSDDSDAHFNRVYIFAISLTAA